MCRTHGGTFLRLGIRVTAVGEKRQAFKPRKGQTEDPNVHFTLTDCRATGNGAVAGNGT